jgi:hypothetical protein
MISLGKEMYQWVVDLFPLNLSITGKLLKRELVKEVIRYAKYDDLEPIN